VPETDLLLEALSYSRIYRLTDNYMIDKRERRHQFGPGTLRKIRIGRICNFNDQLLPWAGVRLENSNMLRE